LAELTESPPPAPAPGFLARLLGSRAETPPEGGGPAKQAADKLRQLAAAAADGYAMSLRRIERVLPILEIEPMECSGAEYDPELMEVVEVVDGGDLPSGTVVEDVRPGYLWRGKVLRFAQVKVAR
jgi:molecular chaperone GrpE